MFSVSTVADSDDISGFPVSNLGENSTSAISIWGSVCSIADWQLLRKSSAVVTKSSVASVANWESKLDSASSCSAVDTSGSVVTIARWKLLGESGSSAGNSRLFIMTFCAKWELLSESFHPFGFFPTVGPVELVTRSQR